MKATLAQIIARCGGTLAQGDPQTSVCSLAPLERASAEDISFLAQAGQAKYRHLLRTCRAAAVIIPPEALPDCPVAAIVTPNPYLYFAKLSQWLNAPPRPSAGIHPLTALASQVPTSTHVGAGASIGAEVRLGERVIIEAGCHVGNGVTIADDSWLRPGVVLYPGVRLGSRVLIHAGAVIGGDGFGFAPDPEKHWVKIEQVGSVRIGDDVEIGANTTIDRGALDDTVIENGVKIDNLVQIAHNVRIGEDSIIAGCTGIAGSTVIGKRCQFGGASMIIGHITIADDTIVSGSTFIGRAIATPGQHFSNQAPQLQHAEWLKNFAQLRRLDAMADKIRHLEARLATIETSAQRSTP